MKTAVFPGSFDPVTKGHEDLIKRASPLFDKIYVAIGVNSAKKSLFSIEQRINWLKQCFAENDHIEILTYEGLTVSLCKKMDANFIIRGIRNEADFRYENDIAQTNRQLHPDIESVFFVTSPELANISSTIIRDIYLNHGNYKQFMPDILIDE